MVLQGRDKKSYTPRSDLPELNLSFLELGFKLQGQVSTLQSNCPLPLNYVQDALFRP